MSSRSVVNNTKIKSISVETQLSYVYHIKELFDLSKFHPQVQHWSLTHNENDKLCKTYIMYTYRSKQ